MAPRSRSTADRWRLLVTPPAPGAWNMAVDEALVDTVRDGGDPILRLYRWSPPCLSLGRNQPTPSVSELERLRGLGVDVLRRATGGRAVLHDDELTYAVVVRDRVFGSARSAYRRINEVLVEAVSSLGVPADLHPGTGERAPPPGPRPCFADPVEGEVLARQRKLVGSAQVRVGGVLLQHGAIPLRPTPLAQAVGLTAPGEAGEPAYLLHVAPRPVETTEVIDAIADAWSRLVAPLAPAPLDSIEQGRARDRETRYRSDAWTGRI